MSADKHSKGKRRRLKALALVEGLTHRPARHAAHAGLIVCHKREILHDVDKPRTAAGRPQYSDFTPEMKRLEKDGLVKRVRVNTGGMFPHICRTYLVVTGKPDAPKPRRKMRESHGRHRR